MKKLLIIQMLLAVALSGLAEPLQWVCEWPKSKAQQFELYQGEIATFEPTFRINGGAPTNLPVVTVWYQTNGMDRAWWHTDGAVFHPTNDVGAASYRFFVDAAGDGGKLYRANGTLRMLPSPGFTPNTIAPPVAALDFDSIDVSNAPYYTKDETDAKIVELSPPADLSNATNYTDSVASSLREGLAVAASSATNYTDAVASSLRESVAVAASSATNYTDGVAATLRGEIAAAQPADYATVSNKAMTALQSYTETDPTISSWAKAASKPTYSLNDVAPNVENWLGVPGTTAGGKSIKVLAKTVNGVIEGGMTVTGSSNNDNNTTKYRYAGVTVTRNGTATDYLFDTSSQSGIVRRSELASKANAADVASISAMLNAENARFVSTNYNSATQIPSASVEAKIDGSWLTIWDELTRWNWLTDTYLPGSFYTKAQVNSALADKADRAWGFYDSHTGLYAPDGFTWVSSPKIAIAGGLAYSRTLTNEGAIWVLEANGMVAETGGLTNGFFRVSDDEGNALFEIVKGDKRTVGAQANSVQVIGAFVPSKLQIGYAVVADTHPTLQITASLSDPDWYDEDSASCPANVTWSGVSGAYVATVQAKSASATQLFVKAEYQVGGETYIKNVGPISVDGGIYCTDGIHRVRFVYNNGSVTLEVVQ